MGYRKNAATLSATEKQKFVDALLTIKRTTLPGHRLSIYDEFVAEHLAVCYLVSGPAGGTNGAHGGPAFFPWHREFICRFEKALQSVDSSVSLPYWNWNSGNAADTNSIFTDDFMGPPGTGSSQEVQSGHFTVANGWVIDPALRPTGYGGALRRNSQLDPSGLPSSQANSALTRRDYNTFEPDIEWNSHGPVHIWVGGNMTYMTSPNDPIFFLHHANVDRLWAIWQETHPGPANYNAPIVQGSYGHRIDDRMWPWDGGQSSPAWITGMSDCPDEDIRPFLPSFPPTDIVTPRMVIDHFSTCGRYDTDPIIKIKDHIKPEIKEKIEIKEHKEHKEIKEIKEGKFEIKEHKEIKEIKEGKIEIKEHKEIKEKDKDIVEGPISKPHPDPVVNELANRVAAVEQNLAEGKSFIKPDERPPVGKKAFKKKKSG